MPPARRKSTRKQPRRRSSGSAGDAAIKRLNSSLDAAHDALTELRKNLGRGGRGVVGDVHKRVTDLRKDARKLNKSVRTELEQLQKSLAGTRSRKTAGRGGTRKATTRRTKATTSRAKAASRTKARKPAGRRKAGAGGAAKR
jgi:hypothetical protein